MTDEEIGECIDAGKVPLFHVPELLPLLLLGITDDSLEIATSTYERLEGVGYIYKKFIDELDKRKIQVCGGNLKRSCTHLCYRKSFVGINLVVHVFVYLSHIPSV